MKRKPLWAGIDLGVESASVCVLNDSGEIAYECICPASIKDIRRELTHFRRNRFATVGLEAGSGAHVARGLRSLGYPVVMYELRQLSKFLRVRRNKTDAGDAIGIAEAGRIGTSVVSKVYLKSLESQSLQSCLAVRRHLIRHRVAAATMLARQIELFGGRLHCNARSDGLRSAVETEIKRVFRNSSDGLTAQLRQLAQYCDNLVANQRILDRELKQAAMNNDVCRRFMEIPGVGPLCALSFYAAVDDPRRFSRSSDIGSYFGLAPRIHESGVTRRKTRISKMGNKSVRSLLVHASGLFLHYCRPESELREWTLRLEERRGRLPSRVALARRLAVVMLAIWKSGDSYDPTHSRNLPKGGPQPR